ncbi:acyclic terpene utilization AtuA family protein [Bordetella sp. BOR01]|uniref:acyclic terpene utilization AtuA family protein n=1 Tax=Bordetella sp. BOR01 TaxID=2854779 RepID=UPI001C45CBF0|nr:acyclic terpene utilization AtuA family protein [Bordetella sp. BOR01]MBV7484993.1 DUF1446 domain-containing protein [Bordetella sp. BOR01]
MSRSSTRALRIGAGASFADDRIAPAVALAERGELDYLAFECLAERTVARENQSRLKNPKLGYTPRLMDRMRLVLPVALKNGVKIVTNMGAANPIAAVELVHEFARNEGVGPLHSAAVLGDDITDLLRQQPGLRLMESGAPLEDLLPRMVSANAYFGADVIVRGLATGAQLVVTGRVADPSLYLAAAMHYYGWSYDDWDRIAAGTAAGHLLECCAQVSGGCFAAPGRKEVPDLARLGFPYVDMLESGDFTVSKLKDTGGRVDLATCKEQLIYEMHDPASYITPDCVLDVTELDMRQVEADRVRITGARARPRTDTYKVTVGYTDGFIGEGQISYAGIDAVARAELAASVVQQRLADAGHRYGEVRVDLIGIDSLHARRAHDADPYEVRMRIAARTTDRKAAEAVGFETRALHVNGPAGGAGGSDPMVKEVLAVQSVLVPRGKVDPRITIREFRS